MVKVEKTTAACGVVWQNTKLATTLASSSLTVAKNKISKTTDQLYWHDELAETYNLIAATSHQAKTMLNNGEFCYEAIAVLAIAVLPLILS
jgi:hypothetical protein